MHNNSHTISEKINTIVMDIERTASASGRDPKSVQLVAVSKTIDSEKVRRAIESGVTLLGENYIQEAKEKIEKLNHYPVKWHFIGHLQSNKAKYAVKLFDLIHTVDSFKLAEVLNRQAQKTGKVQEVLIQVNISREAAKSGVDTADTIPLIKKIAALDNVAIMGLMTMPPFFQDPEKARPYFKALNDLSVQISSESIDRVQMKELSMGMTGDYKPAIEEGATLVRIGTAIFGKRK